MTSDLEHMKRALRLARRGFGSVSPNPMVGAVLVKNDRVIGEGWHHRAGEPHAEIEALRNCEKRGHSPKGATLYVTLEPCSSHGRTPPCTGAIIAAGIARVVAAATDPNPKHRGHGFELLKRAKIRVASGLLADEAGALNECFNHWIVHRTPFVTVKAAMTLDGKIATATGESKWITGEEARAQGMILRRGADAIVAGIETVLADDPSLTYRPAAVNGPRHSPRRVILDSQARTPLDARVVADADAALTTIVATNSAPARRVAALERKVAVWRAPDRGGRIDLKWLLKRLGRESVTSVLVEGGGEVNGSFLLSRLAQRVAFFYAPKILGGHASRRGAGGMGARNWNEVLTLTGVTWRKLGPDLMLSARVAEVNP
jgi:diaminohydroxyphosphoribosylaminopyrimidine deaminase/5-amino-6-(5-phosphoribosylamino)uracil reductase